MHLFQGLCAGQCGWARQNTSEDRMWSTGCQSATFPFIQSDCTFHCFLCRPLPFLPLGLCLSCSLCLECPLPSLGAQVSPILHSSADRPPPHRSPRHPCLTLPPSSVYTSFMTQITSCLTLRLLILVVLLITCRAQFCGRLI